MIAATMIVVVKEDGGDADGTDEDDVDIVDNGEVDANVDNGRGVGDSGKK
jgi:hypothetical protein